MSGASREIEIWLTEFIKDTEECWHNMWDRSLVLNNLRRESIEMKWFVLGVAGNILVINDQSG